MLFANHYLFQKGVFLKGNIPSLKNSKEIQTYKKWIPDPDDPSSKILRQFNRLGPSKTVNKYLIDWENQYPMHKVDIQNLFRNDKPWIIGFYFVRDSKRKFDFNNATQIVQDLMVKYNYFGFDSNGKPNEDHMDNIWPVPLGYTVRPENPGVFLCNMKDIWSINSLISYFEGIISKSDVPLSPEIDHCLYAIKELNKFLVK